jgi:alpha/beta hydrolase fold
VFAHGGAFCLGDLEAEHWRCLLYAQIYAQKAGVVVVSVDYGLAPNTPFRRRCSTCSSRQIGHHNQAENLAVDPTPHRHRRGKRGLGAGRTGWARPGCSSRREAVRPSAGALVQRSSVTGDSSI